MSSELCIQVMDLFFDTIEDVPEIAPVFDQLRDTYFEVLQKVLSPYAAELAYMLYSEDPYQMRALDAFIADRNKRLKAPGDHS